MVNSFKLQVKELKKNASRFDVVANRNKLFYLSGISALKIPLNQELISYYEILLYLCAYPSNKKIVEESEKELRRISSSLKSVKIKPVNKFKNSGLPFTITNSRFSHDFIQWLQSQPDCKMEPEGFIDHTFQLSEVLRYTLPSLEVSETTAGLDNDELFRSLLVPKKEILSFLVNELAKLNKQPSIKDLLFDGLDLYINIAPVNKSFSKAFNRIPVKSTFFHDGLIKNFDHEKLMETKLPSPVKLTEGTREHLIKTIKFSLALNARETDPATFMEENTLRLFELERGISISIYGMKANRQLPLESYIGFTLFKNGFPAAYGGSWVFGEHAHFGINIFEVYRGGESGFIMCQLLRLYRQAFKVNYFEVEAYQFGLDNPEGIHSGAFWFYHRYGFRPLKKQLQLIAKREHKRITTIEGYRSSIKTLKQFTESNVVLNLNKKEPEKVINITARVRKMIHKKYRNNRLLAEEDCIVRFIKKTGFKKHYNEYETQVLKEVSLWAEAYQIVHPVKLQLLLQMIKTKPVELYKYQELLLQFFKK